jgi:hypothetical protein
MPIRKAPKLSIQKTKGTPKYILKAKVNGKTKILGGFSTRSDAQTKAKRLKKTGLVK